LRQEVRHPSDGAPGSYGDAQDMAAVAAGTERRTAMRISRIARRVASVVSDMNYAQRRRDELFLGLRGDQR